VLSILEDIWLIPYNQSVCMKKLDGAYLYDLSSGKARDEYIFIQFTHSCLLIPKVKKE